MKITSQRPFSFAAVLVLLAALALPGGAAELKKRQAKTVLAEASSADPVKARELYQLVAAGTAKLPEQRAEALYRLALLEAATPAATRDQDLLEKSAAEFLQAFPKDAKRPVVAAIAGLAAETQAKQKEIATLESRIAAGELVKKDDATAVARETAKKAEELELQLRRSKAEIELLRAELAKKDEALTKLKKVVVGGG